MTLTVNCLNVTVGEPLNPWQLAGLNLVARLQGGRDVVLAFDLTGSVNFNDEGRIRLRQIIEDSLKPGDRVYVIPFASEVNPLKPEQNSFLKPIKFTGKEEDINQILALFPTTNTNLQNTDIQKAEAFIYKGLAQRNQCRFAENQKIKPQSVVWITDAPLLTQPGIASSTWIETPANSPFRQKDSPESQERQAWLQALPLQKNSQKIINNNKSYDLTVIDIAPTVQEFCTPIPGGGKTCLVNSYLLNQLWLPVLLLLVTGITVSSLLIYWFRLNSPWKLKINRGDDFGTETYTLNNGERIYLGGDKRRSMHLPGEQRGYLERKGNQLTLKITQPGSLSYNDKQKGSVPINIKKEFMLELPDCQEQKLKLSIKVIKQ